MAPPKNRQELYERIQASSKDDVILEEMIRLGFWPRGTGLPGDPTDELKRKNDLRAEVTALTTEQNRLSNLAYLRKELMKKRLADSKAKQALTKERRERERIERARQWKAKQDTEIGYLGPDVSGGLSARDERRDRLAKYGLPSLATPGNLAQAMGVTVPKLRQLAFTRTVSSSTNYIRFEVPKKTGGTRQISAPMPHLKRAQRWILDALLQKVTIHDAAHGFQPKRSIVTNAAPHVGASIVLNLDLKDFFPSVLYPRVKGTFRALGYSEATAIVLALLCTEPDTQQVELDGKRWHVAMGPRHLPQGAPTSPALTNLLCRRLDRRLQGAAKKLGYTYTRYADDLTFSAKAKPKDVARLLWQVRQIVGGEGFVVHPDKTRIVRKGRQLEVTGIVVNEKPGIDRAQLRRFRALLHQLGKTGLEGKHWGSSKDVLSSARGYANFVAMVDAKKGKAFLDQVEALEKKYGKSKPPPRPKPAAPPPAAPTAPAPLTETAPTADEAKPEDGSKKKKWWQIF